MKDKPRLVVYGAGGHGRVVADAAEAAGFDVLGFLDDSCSVGSPVLAWQVLGGADWLNKPPPRYWPSVLVALGIGANHVREELAERFPDRVSAVVHPSAVLSRHATIAPGAVVLANATVNAGARIGRGAIINTGAIIEHDNVIGPFAHVASGVALGGDVHVGAEALIGTGASVRRGCTIGDRSIVGAGAAVVTDVPPDTTVVGVPARALRR